MCKMFCGRWLVIGCPGDDGKMLAYSLSGHAIATIRVFNFEGLKFCGLLKHKEFVDLHF